MCFYEQFRFACGDFKWGNFRQHCQKEYRMGETCGMKLVNETIPQPQKCRMCERADTKLRKRQQESDRITRWQAEGRNPASVLKSREAITTLDYEIEQIYAEISKMRSSLNGGRQPASRAYQQPAATAYQQAAPSYQQAYQQTPAYSQQQAYNYTYTSYQA
ncbi:hypothetical protein EJ08DRAFT_646645 [Tothia fuscella]|uniref:Uncharacterized protein n=1 Tax=Tothia fuscella TaxID=1048955 RepID=A0A9P4NZI1_9PEZI|nr:hypothetical protein EJ08DRAFT_646645 [Tothia fuscella]